MTEKFSKNALSVIDKLEKNGFEAYAVGGCVRDIIMGKKPQDYDIATNAKSHEIKDVFSSFKIIETGLKHGTVTVLFEGEPFEITTYRIESTYSDNRHPDKVAFTSKLSDDLSRRDFTVNSLAFNPGKGVVDLFSGQNDIREKVIRCVGIPEERFKEDSLRILRGLRFAAVLGFKIEEKTKKAMLSQKHLIKNISKERIFSELSKLLLGKNVKNILTEFSDVLGEIIPEINEMNGFDQHNFHHIYDVLTHTAVVTENTPSILHLRLAALFHDSAKPFCFSLDGNGVGHFYSHATQSAHIAEQRLTELKCDTATKQAVIALVKAHDTPIEESEKIIKRRLQALGKDLFFDLIDLKRADTKGLAPEFASRSEHFNRLQSMAEEILQKDECFSLKHLAVNGNDLIEKGYSGKEIGKGLNLLLEAVIDEKCKNTKQELLFYLEHHN